MISEFRWVRIKRKSGSILLDNQQRLETSSDDWHKFNEKADKIQRKHSAARTSDEREKWKRKAEELIDYMRDKYGYDDNVERIIDMYYLDRL